MYLRGEGEEVSYPNFFTYFVKLLSKLDMGSISSSMKYYIYIYANYTSDIFFNYNQIVK